MEKHRAGQDLPVTEGERTQLRALAGCTAMAFNADQPSPSITGEHALRGDHQGDHQDLESGNKTLRFAKANSDCGLMFQHVADQHQVSFMAYSDAKFCYKEGFVFPRGYMVLMTNKEVTNDSHEGNYVVLDWRSWKLAREHGAP